MKLASNSGQSIALNSGEPLQVSSLMIKGFNSNPKIKVAAELFDALNCWVLTMCRKCLHAEHYLVVSSFRHPWIFTTKNSNSGGSLQIPVKKNEKWDRIRDFVVTQHLTAVEGLSLHHGTENAEDGNKIKIIVAPGMPPV
ncbi:MAG: hypothetical protein U5M23_02960 [Marinagarivorans sp.]|nr:hypothetical protein [Marinagarivorans sp.]